MDPQNSNTQPKITQPTTLPLAQPVHHDLPSSPMPSDPKKAPRSKWPLLAAGLLILAVAGGWLVWHSRETAPKAVALTKISVQLEWVNNPEFAGMYVAQDLGYYKAVGLDVNLKEFQDTTDVNQELADGKADYGVSTPLEIILGRDKGQKTKAIAAIYQTSAYSIASPKTANIKTPADFKGKILGNSGDNNQAKVTYAALIANAGLTAAQTTIKTVDFDVVKVFTEKQADTYDLYRTDQAYLLQKANIPYNQIFPEQYGLDIYGDVLSTSDSKIAQNPAQVRAFTQATLKGWQYAIDHQPETLAILLKHANALYKDSEYLKYDLTNTAPLIRPTGNQPLGGMQYVPWNRAYQAVQAAGLLKTGFDVSEAYAPQFVK
jgi:ABC-type nitrate/sulfonate/bicarbonate transport system substrate-binding protein